MTDDLTSLRGVGPSIARDLRDLGYAGVAQLRDEDPERMFAALCELRGRAIDRCVLYVFRCAVYAASTETPDSELLQWWAWKDQAPRPA